MHEGDGSIFLKINDFPFSVCCRIRKTIQP